MASAWKRASVRVSAECSLSKHATTAKSKEILTRAQVKYRAQEAQTCAKAKKKHITYKLDGYEILNKLKLQHLKRVFHRIRLLETDFKTFYKVCIHIRVAIDNRLNVLYSTKGL